MKHTTLLFLVLALLVLGCKQKKENQPAEEPPVAKVELVYHVEGMTCDHCEMSVKKGVGELEGIVSVEANFEDSTARVVFDPAKTNNEAIVAAIEKRGYKAAPDQK